MQFLLPLSAKPKLEQLNEELYPGVEDYWECTTEARKHDPIFGIVAIVLHVIAGDGADRAFSAVKARMASWHWVVPAMNDPQHGHFVWACAPEARAARHTSGAGARINQTSLGVAVIAEAALSEWQMAALASIVRFAWSKYPNLRTVQCGAEDANGAESPIAWQQLRRMVIDPPWRSPALVSRATPMSLLPRARQMPASGKRAAASGPWISPHLPEAK